MKRFRLATKLALAIVPMALVALATGALVSWTFLEEARAEERVSSAARVAADAMDALVAVSAEQSRALESAVGDSDANLEAVRNRSDRALDALSDSVRDLVPRAAGPASGIASAIFSDSSQARARLDDFREIDPLSDDATELFDDIGLRLITVTSQSTLYFGEEGRAREGAGAVALARASFASSQQERLMARVAADETAISAEEFVQRFTALESTVADWLNNADDNSPTVTALGLARTQVLEPGMLPDEETFPEARDELLADTAADILARVAGSADAAATTVRNEALTVAGVVLGVLLVTIVTALVVGRSTVRRVRSVTAAARHVADVDLPKMVDALSNPKGQLDGTIPVELEQAGPDEVGELARSFSSLHGTLVEVANRQMEILRRGVSEIFVTLARRNGSLVDRQLALIDSLEAGEEDPEVLDGYYKLDHLSTRMRRNAESLLVLAGSESPRMWSEPLEMDEVVRAALGEVDEYQRVDVLALEPTRLKGRVVTDLSHLMSELLDNATQFSPPSERVRVTGLFDDNGYVITIADSGVGISETRMAEINRLIGDPPVLGLALEPTLGMYVVARLADRHGIGVRLVPGVPGTTVRITLPRTLLHTAVETEPKAAPPRPEPVVEAPAESNGKSPEEPKSATIPPYAFRSGSHDGDDRQAAPLKPPASASERLQETTGPEEKGRETSGGGESSPQPAEPARAMASEEPASPHNPPPVRREGPSPARDGDNRKVPSPTPAPRPLTREDASLPRRAPANPAPPPAGPTVASPGERIEITPPAARPTPPSVPGRTPRPVDTDAGHASARHDAGPAPTRLPTRSPGSSFRGDVSAEGSSTVSQRGAEGIRNALDGYRLGRDIASSPPRRHEQSPDESPVDDLDEGRDS
ncbi:MAG TPA: ATP-binding protein [Acidimicrobiia bacterium]|nr:ATP-binding protein [Acidimicrobiia bacterium]